MDNIKSWDKQDRPREKLINKGISALSDAELLAILIGSGSRNESAVTLAKRILNHVDNNLSNLGNLSIAELTSKFKGIGSAKAVTIITALEFGRRRNESQVPKLKSISSSIDLFNLMHPVLENLPHEEFWCLLLSRSNKVIRKIKISQGGISGTIVDNRIILKHAIENLASSLVICHNHPSGNINPSNQDIEITRKLKSASNTMDIQLLDHIIIGNSSYYSFNDENLM